MFTYCYKTCSCVFLWKFVKSHSIISLKVCILKDNLITSIYKTVLWRDIFNWVLKTSLTIWWVYFLSSITDFFDSEFFFNRKFKIAILVWRSNSKLRIGFLQIQPGEYIKADLLFCLTEFSWNLFFGRLNRLFWYKVYDLTETIIKSVDSIIINRIGFSKFSMANILWQTISFLVETCFWEC